MNPAAVRLVGTNPHFVFQENLGLGKPSYYFHCFGRESKCLEYMTSDLVCFSLGCGTGKYLSVNSQVYNLGCDYCEALVEIARKKGDEVLVCDNLNLPFRDQCFNAVISIGGKTTHLHSGPSKWEFLSALFFPCGFVSVGCFEAVP